jgi:cobalamin biosynthesis protein CobT
MEELGVKLDSGEVSIAVGGMGLPEIDMGEPGSDDESSEEHEEHEASETAEEEEEEHEDEEDEEDEKVEESVKKDKILSSSRKSDQVCLTEAYASMYPVKK